MIIFMLKNLKKVCAITTSIVVLCSATIAFANTWKLSGYDTSDAAIYSGKFACVYQEIDDYGVPTGNYKSGSEILNLNLGLAPYAKNVAWGNPYWDTTYSCRYSQKDENGKYVFVDHSSLPPHDCGNKEYNKLILDGVEQERYAATGAFSKLEYRWTNVFWEKAAPYKIVQQKQVVNNEGNLYSDDSYPLAYTGQNASVTTSDCQIGVDVRNFPTGNVTGSEYAFNNSVPRWLQRTLIGPNFETGGTMSTFEDVTFPEVQGVHGVGVFQNGTSAVATWVDAGYEAASPFRYYQILKLDDYLMDGSNSERPLIYRYTGGNAKPSITYQGYFVDFGKYDSITRTAPVCAYLVLDGRVTSEPIPTGEIATLDVVSSINTTEEKKSVIATFVARTPNGLTTLSAEVILPDNSNSIDWGKVHLEKVSKELNSFKASY